MFWLNCSTIFSISSGDFSNILICIFLEIPYIASAILPVIAAIVSLSSPIEITLRMTSSKSLDSIAQVIASGTLL